MPLSRFARYSRQILLPEIGEKGQRRLRGATAFIAGCGATGSAIASVLVRAGVGRTVIVDRDIVEESNLQRQLLFTEGDIGEPKAVAAAAALRRANTAVEVEGIVADLAADNIEGLLRDASVILDGTDNMEARYIINDASVKHSIPWVYCGAVGTYGMVMAVVPGKGPCLRCLFPEPPAPGALPTCDTAGVLGTAPLAAGALAATGALRLLTGRARPRLIYIDVWKQTLRRLRVERREGCPACARRDFEFLAVKRRGATVLCGRDSVQVSPARKAEVSFDEVTRRLSRVGSVRRTPYLLRAEVEGVVISLFPDGRAIITGISDEKRARTLYSKFIGA